MSNALKSIRRSHVKREADALVKAGMIGSVQISRVEKLRKQLSKPNLEVLISRLLVVPQDQVQDRIAGMSIPHLTRLWDAVKVVAKQLYAKHATKEDATLEDEVAVDTPVTTPPVS